MINSNTAISLSSLQEIIKNELYNIDSYWIIAEINEIKVNSNDHCYLELIEKDAKTQYLKAKVSATIWASFYRMLKSYFETTTKQSLKKGINILVKVQVQYHELYGLSLNIIDIDPSYTVGDLQLKKQQIIEQLQEDGVFDMNKELPFPKLPQRIAVISSSNAAGYQDFMNHLTHNQYGYLFKTTLFDSIMQGNNAEQSIISAFEQIYKRADDFDIVVIIRGGGSQADLSCFDLYNLVYNATQLPLPFLTGIGHDKDVSILDMVACKMLKTPTAVADYLVNIFISLEQQLYDYGSQLKNFVSYQLDSEVNLLNNLYYNIRSISSKYIYKEQLLINNLFNKVNAVSAQYVNNQKNRLVLLQTKLSVNDPVTMLNKGYSITLHNGKRIKPDTELHENDEIKTILTDRKIISVINKIEQ